MSTDVPVFGLCLHVYNVVGEKDRSTDVAGEGEHWEAAANRWTSEGGGEEERISGFSRERDFCEEDVLSVALSSLFASSVLLFETSLSSFCLFLCGVHQWRQLKTVPKEIST